ncbi:MULTISPECIES: AraC family transcriptional regulator [unclassified Sphingobium]|uniref:HTH araC/xylS-type domain-containing protein n=1 Tax=Sphingobium indicum (strain DSM 16412 / CCM 7286 / MTCC 6364 / B90A) TaxID=861109 RepID=A0A1L5BRJ5_SPHIB|nr:MULTISPECIES: AraC family transcriptional regulator [unclassified Sphingobium]APL95515.1 hypothetical protein SIDU_13895 [Sphingobium indicum B90A]CAD7341737.1 HTH-type transcriptional activator RhaS [Sphingobium sp. S6]CAD7341932.1 HTH-type transcriptional activator RhaS [Sphingobium sp. S8]
MQVARASQDIIAGSPAVPFVDLFRDAFPNYRLRRSAGPAPQSMMARRVGHHRLVSLRATSAGLLSAVPTPGASANDDVKLLWQIEGTSRLAGPELEALVRPGDAIILLPGRGYELETSPNYSMLSLTFHREAFGSWTRLVERQFGSVIPSNSALHAAAAALRAILGARSQPAFDALGVRDVVRSFFNAAALHEELASNSPSHLPYRLRQAREAILDNLANGEFGPADLAREIGISSRLLYLEFSRHRMTPRQFIQDLRLEQCRQQIEAAGGARNLTAIALANGFSSSSQFSRAFRAKFGASPSAYRTQLTE